MSDGPMSYAIPIGIELAGMFLLILGVSVELTTRAELGHVLISVGSVLITVGSIIWGKIFTARHRKTDD